MKQSDQAAIVLELFNKYREVLMELADSPAPVKYDSLEKPGSCVSAATTGLTAPLSAKTALVLASTKAPHNFFPLRNLPPPPARKTTTFFLQKIKFRCVCHQRHLRSLSTLQY